MADASYNKKIFEATFGELIEKNIFVDVPVYGLSMFPFFLPGDILRVVKASKCKLHIGDMVVFNNGVKLVAHRLIKIDYTKGLVVTKGDNVLNRDSVIRLDEIIGVAVKHFRNNKEIVWSNRSFIKRLISFLSPVLGYLSSVFIRVWFKIFKNKKGD